jgi:hypothetical protein
MVSHHLCHVLGIDMNADDLVIFIGSDDASKNGDAIKEWIAGQSDLATNSRKEMTIELRDRLSDVLFELEAAIRSS